MNNELIDEVTAKEAHRLLDEYMRWRKLAKSSYVLEISCCGSDKGNVVTAGYEETDALCQIVKQEAAKIASIIWGKLEKMGVNL